MIIRETFRVNDIFSFGSSSKQEIKVWSKKTLKYFSKVDILLFMVWCLFQPFSIEIAVKFKIDMRKSKEKTSIKIM